ncbi:MAG: hypothetical protein ACK4F8_00175 [Aquabacterium sp.]
MLLEDIRPILPVLMAAPIALVVHQMLVGWRLKKQVDRDLAALQAMDRAYEAEVLAELGLTRSQR